MKNRLRGSLLGARRASERGKMDLHAHPTGTLAHGGEWFRGPFGGLGLYV